MTLTESHLKSIAPRAYAALWIPYLNTALDIFAINTTRRQAAFLAQVCHESGEFSRLEENSNYTAARLMVVWPKRFPTFEAAQPYHRQPEKIANLVYANRLGNGPPESGDGWRYRGRGLIQLTGKSNYHSAGQGIGLDLVQSPDLLKEPKYAALSAGWFWKTRGCNELADAAPGEDDTEDFVRITKIINGGTVGLDDRKEYWQKAKEALA